MNQFAYTGTMFGRENPPAVLVVEDYPAVADVVCTILERVGCDVWAAYSAETALELLPEAEWDLLITDWRMPGLSGLELLRRRDMTVPAILMSAGQPEGILFELHALNAVWLQKPFSPSQLIDLVVASTAGTEPKAS
jgi:two-component system response regulator GlrR